MGYMVLADQEITATNNSETKHALKPDLTVVDINFRNPPELCCSLVCHESCPDGCVEAKGAVSASFSVWSL